MELNKTPQRSLITTRDDDHNHQLVKSIIAMIYLLRTYSVLLCFDLQLYLILKIVLLGNYYCYTHFLSQVRKWSTERLDNLPQVTQLLRSRARTWTPALLPSHSPQRLHICRSPRRHVGSLWGSRCGYVSFESSKATCYCSPGTNCRNKCPTKP